MLKHKEQDLVRLGSGSTFQSINRNHLESLSIPVPSLAEQKRIVAILTEQMAAVEKARAAAEVQLEAAGALLTAYLRQIFPNNGSKLPSGWQWVVLDNLCEESTGIRDPRSTPSDEFVYVDISAVDNKTKRITEEKRLHGSEAPSRARQVIRADDVIVSTTRPNLNAVAMVSPELDNQICSTGFAVLRPNVNLNANFLFAYVRSTGFVESLSSLVKGALYPAVTDRQVRAQTIPLPPIVEQKRIAAILTEQMAAVEQARVAVEAELLELAALPRALLSQAFSGEI